MSACGDGETVCAEPWGCREICKARHMTWTWTWYALFIVCSILCVFVHDRQSPMKNLEVKFSLSELEFRCKNLFLIWEKHWEARI